MNLLDGSVELLDCDETLLVVRQGRDAEADVTYIDGLPAALHPIGKFGIVATVQPMAGRDLLLVPEAFRERETLWLWQRYEGAIALGARMNLGDVVVREGLGYQVQTVEDWGSYARCMLVGIDLGTYAGSLDVEALPDVYPQAPAP